MGEKLDEFEVFHPERMASRILGMGDVLTLIEKASTTIDEKEAERLAKKVKNNGFDMNDLLDQMRQIKKMGSLKSIIGMLPGVGSQIKDLDSDAGEKQMKLTEAVILSMTKKEREKPSLIDAKRKRRIAAGSGTKVEDVNRLLKQFDQMQKMMKQMGVTGNGSAKRSKMAMLRGLNKNGFGGGGFPGM